MTVTVNIVSNVPNLSWEKEADARSYELYLSVDGGDYALVAEPDKDTITYVDVRRAGVLRYKIRKITSLQKSLFSDTVEQDYFMFQFHSTGDGSGLGYFNLKCSETVTAKLTGTARFYTNIEGTTGESSEMTFVANTLTRTHIKAPSGTSVMRIKNKILEWGNPVTGSPITGDGWNTGGEPANEGLNWPICEVDCSKFLPICYSINVFGLNNTYGDVTHLTESKYYEIANGYPSHTVGGEGSIVTADVSEWGDIEVLDIWDQTEFTGNLTAKANLAVLWLGGYQDFTINIEQSIALKTIVVSSVVTNFNASGSLNGLLNVENIVLQKPTTISGNISTQTKLKILQLLSTDNITIDNITACPEVYIFQPFSKILNSATVNQIIADLWANKTEGKKILSGKINLMGATGSEAPTGQGLTDLAALQAYYTNWTFSVRT